MAAGISGLTKQDMMEAAGPDHGALHASMVKFHAIEASKCMKASAKEALSMLHKSAAGSHSEAYLSHSTGAADCAEKSDCAWNATMKCYGMGKAGGTAKDANMELAIFTDPSLAGHLMRKRIRSDTKAEDKIDKGLYTVAMLAQCLDCLYRVCQSVAIEEQIEADDSPLPAMLQQAVKTVGDILVSMAREEADELFADGDDVDMMMVASLPTDKREAIVKYIKEFYPLASVSSDKRESLIKVVAALDSAGKGNINQAIDALITAVNEDAELTKLGARNSAADKARIQSAHDLMKDMGANCEAMANGDEKTVQAMDLLKVQLSDATARSTALEAKIVDYGPTLAVILEKVAKIEARPLPAKASLYSVDKGGASGGNGSGQLQPENVAVMLANMSKPERDHFLMKIALANPVPVIQRHPVTP